MQFLDARSEVGKSYQPFVSIKKRNIETMFAMPRADNLRALGPDGSGRGPAKPYKAEESRVTQTANTAHSVNQNTVSGSRTRRRTVPVETAAMRRSNGSSTGDELSAGRPWRSTGEHIPACCLCGGAAPAVCTRFKHTFEQTCSAKYVLFGL